MESLTSIYCKSLSKQNNFLIGTANSSMTNMLETTKLIIIDIVI